MSHVSDTYLFELIHELIQQQEVQEKDRRSDDRKKYEFVQMLASYDGAQLPRQADFQKVLCHDLSPQGFSFYTPTAPKASFVVVALGNVPWTFFSAEVIHFEPVKEKDSNQLVVGCRFKERIE